MPSHHPTNPCKAIRKGYINHAHRQRNRISKALICVNNGWVCSTQAGRVSGRGKKRNTHATSDDDNDKMSRPALALVHQSRTTIVEYCDAWRRCGRPPGCVVVGWGGGSSSSDISMISACEGCSGYLKASWLNVVAIMVLR
jgi:hypothetical protein